MPKVTGLTQHAHLILDPTTYEARIGAFCPSHAAREAAWNADAEIVLDVLRKLPAGTRRAIAIKIKLGTDGFYLTQKLWLS